MTGILENFGMQKPSDFGYDDGQYILQRHRIPHWLVTLGVRKISGDGKIVYSHCIHMGSIVDLLKKLDKYARLDVDAEEYYLINHMKITPEEFKELNQGELVTF